MLNRTISLCRIRKNLTIPWCVPHCTCVNLYEVSCTMACAKKGCSLNTLSKAVLLWSFPLRGQILDAL